MLAFVFVSTGRFLFLAAGSWVAAGRVVLESGGCGQPGPWRGRCAACFEMPLLPFSSRCRLLAFVSFQHARTADCLPTRYIVTRSSSERCVPVFVCSSCLVFPVPWLTASRARRTTRYSSYVGPSHQNQTEGTAALFLGNWQQKFGKAARPAIDAIDDERSIVGRR